MKVAAQLLRVEVELLGDRLQTLELGLLVRDNLLVVGLLPIVRLYRAAYRVRLLLLLLLKVGRHCLQCWSLL